MNGEIPNQPGCVFCNRIDAADYRGSARGCVRFEPLNPVTPGHMLFVHRVHSSSAAEQPWITGLVFETAADHGRVIGLPFNLITSVGAAATQTIRHLHIHYLPRRVNDGLMLPWTSQESAPSAAADRSPGAAEGN
jgi:histidine triad (HIT) family protein